MRKAFLLGSAFAALCLPSLSQPLKAATLDEVVARLDALERSNARLAKENAQLRERVSHVNTPAPAVVQAVTPKGNPVQHAAVAPSPAPERAVVSIGGAPIYSKAP